MKKAEFKKKLKEILAAKDGKKVEQIIKKIDSLDAAVRERTTSVKVSFDSVRVDNFPKSFDVSNFPKSFEISNLPQKIEVSNFPKQLDLKKPEWYKAPVDKIEIKNEVAIKKPGWIKEVFNEDSFLEKLSVLMSTVLASFAKALAKLSFTVKLNPIERMKPFYVVQLDPETGKAMSKQNVVVHTVNGGGGMGGNGYSKNKSGALVNPATEESVAAVNTNTAPATTPTIYNKAMATHDTEYSQALPAGTKKVVVKLRDLACELKICFTTGESGTKYLTLPVGSSMELDGINLSSATLYFQSSGDAQVCEILAWT